MKKFYRSHFAALCGALCAGAAFLMPQQAVAQNQIAVGYVNPSEVVYPYTGFNNSSTEGGTLYFVVRVEASKLVNYSGASLTGIRVGWGQGAEPMTPDMEVFVREELDGADLALGTKQVDYGWNDISFDSPYVIPSGKDLYLGGKVEWAPGSWLATGVYGYSLPEESQFMANSADVGAGGKLNWIDKSKNDALLLLGLIEASGDEYNDKGSLVDIRANELQSLVTPGDAWIVVKNDGVNAMNSAEITAAFGDAKWTCDIEFSTPIAGGEQKAVTGGVQALGSGEHEIWLSKINGKDVAAPVRVKFNFIGVPEDIESKYVRRPLVERWVSESDYRTPVYTDDWFLPGVADCRDRLSVISHHISDQFMVYHEFDKDVDCEDLQFLVDFAGGDKSRVYVPVFSVDRSYIPRNPLARATDRTVVYNFINPEFTDILYDAALEVPTFASVEASCVPAADKCAVEVSGHIEPGIMPQGEKLRLTVYLVEDGVESASQEFPDDPEVTERYNGRFTHNDLIRASLTAMYGDEVAADGDYSAKFDCELDPEWNLENMRVLAFLNRSGDSYGHMQVINSCETPFDLSAISDVAAPGAQFRVEGRAIVAADGCTADVYTVSGARVSGENLAAGIYIVKPGAGAARKVVIR